MDKLYNPLKLSEYRPLFQNKRILIIGAGAVGSYLAENCVKIGSSVTCVDFDTWTLENAAKHSGLIRTPEDVGKNKAISLAERLQPLLEYGCTAKGIDTDVCMLGPEAIAQYDVIALCVDNFAAKILINELWMQIPQERRPIAIMDGTFNEMAQSVILNGKEFCLRCLISETWLNSSHVRTSCSGPQIRQIDGIPEIVRTSGLASSTAANISSEQFRAYVIGDSSVMNHRIIYTAYPNLELSTSHPMRKKKCPGCSIHAHQPIFLPGNILDIKLSTALQLIKDQLKSNDFEISVYPLNYKNIHYSGYIVSGVCHACGTPITVLRHEGRTFIEDLRCEKCKMQNKPVYYDPNYDSGEILYAFTMETDDMIKSKTMFELGYPLGAHIEVIQRNGAMDFMDADKIIHTYFAFSGDGAMMNNVSKL